MTQSQLAVAAGVSQSMVSKIERGLMKVSFGDGVKILAAVGIEINLVYRGRIKDSYIENSCVQKKVVVIK